MTQFVWLVSPCILFQGSSNYGHIVQGDRRTTGCPPVKSVEPRPFVNFLSFASKFFNVCRSSNSGNWIASSWNVWYIWILFYTLWSCRAPRHETARWIKILISYAVKLHEINDFVAVFIIFLHPCFADFFKLMSGQFEVTWGQKFDSKLTISDFESKWLHDQFQLSKVFEVMLWVILANQGALFRKPASFLEMLPESSRSYMSNNSRTSVFSV